MGIVNISVKLFASYREAVGERELTVTLLEPATVGSLVAQLAARFPALSQVVGSASFAVNRRYQPATAELRDGDEVVILPPVAGGAPAGRRFVVTAEPIDTEVVRAAVADPQAGGVVVFIGVVRARSNSGRAVTVLEYEAYPVMAEEQMAVIGGELTERFGIAPNRIAMVHRIGRLLVGDVAVVIAIASPHRKEAFAACEYAIDRVKDIVPIWKKETGPDGSSWVLP